MSLVGLRSLFLFTEEFWKAMTARVKQLGTSVKCWIVENDVKWLPDTKQTFFSYWIVSRSPVNDFPSHIELFVFIFELPNVTAKSGPFLWIRSAIEGRTMCNKTFLEIISHADICFSSPIIGGDSCLVKHNCVLRNFLQVDTGSPDTHTGPIVPVRLQLRLRLQTTTEYCGDWLGSACC